MPTLDNALAVRETVARLISDVLAGRLHPRIAAGLAPLLNLQLRAIETTDWERRLAELEKQVAKSPGGAGLLGDIGVEAPGSTGSESKTIP